MKLLLLYDVVGWAWYFKARALQKHLRGHFEKIDIAPSKWIKKHQGAFKRYHHIHWFGWLEGRLWSSKYKGISAGISSHNYYYKHFDLAKRVMPRYDALTCTGRILCDEIKQRKMNKNVYLCQNGVDEEMFQPDPIKHDKFTIGWMGQPTSGGFDKGDSSIDMHGYQHVLKPLVESFRDNNDIEFKIMAKTFKNAIPHHEMVKWYNGLDLFIHTGFGTGTPNPVFEAMACGVPCISTAIGAAPEVINHSKNGYLVPRYYNKQQAKECADQIENIINEIQDFDGHRLTKLLGVNARETIEESWTWKQRARNWIPVFKNHGKKL